MTEADQGPLVRPYALTGGRTTHGRSDLALDAVVATTSTGHTALDYLALERGAIVRWCLDPTPLIEIAARLAVPIGVVRVLVGDLKQLQMVDVHQPDRPEVVADRNLLERVLDGLQAL
jgi:hypothetical protein